MWRCGVCLKQISDDNDPVSLSNTGIKICSERCKKKYHKTVDNIENALNGREIIH